MKRVKKLGLILSMLILIVTLSTGCRNEVEEKEDPIKEDEIKFSFEYNIEYENGDSNVSITIINESEKPVVVMLLEMTFLDESEEILLETTIPIGYTVSNNEPYSTEITFSERDLSLTTEINFVIIDSEEFQNQTN